MLSFFSSCSFFSSSILFLSASFLLFFSSSFPHLPFSTSSASVLCLICFLLFLCFLFLNCFSSSPSLIPPFVCFFSVSPLPLLLFLSCAFFLFFSFLFLLFLPPLLYFHSVSVSSQLFMSSLWFQVVVKNQLTVNQSIPPSLRLSSPLFP